MKVIQAELVVGLEVLLVVEVGAKVAGAVTSLEMKAAVVAVELMGVVVAGVVD